MQNIWQNIKKLKYPTLNDDLTCDVLIIGGGMSGILTAYYLNNSNLKVTLVEMNKIGQGTSGFTTGKINIIQGNTYNDLINNFGFNKAKKYLDSQLYGLSLIKENIVKNNIACNFEKTDSYVFTNDKSNIEKINKLKSFFDKTNYKTHIIKNLPINYQVIYGLKGEGYVFHPLKYLYGIANKIKGNIYENTKVINFIKEKNHYIVYTNKNKIKTKYLVFACNYPFFVFPGLMPLKLSTYKSYVWAAESLNQHFDAISIDNPNISIRYFENNLILGGFSHRTTTNINYKQNYLKLKNILKQNFNLKTTCIWSTTDVKTNDFLPFIGLISDNLYIVTGFNKWGMINSTLAGKIISNLILKKDNEYTELFQFHRALSKEKIKSLAYDSFYLTKRFISDKIKKNKNFYKECEVIKINGINYGVYTDENNQKHYAKNTCPHMGCTLIFNRQDKSWDCPCHASKFDIDGNILKGPSKNDIKKEN